jgi:GAF domain-containing protein
MADAFGTHAQPHAVTPLIDGHVPPELSANRRQLLALLRAQSLLAAEPDLRAVLRRVVLVARELVQARYAAAAILGSDGVFDEFVQAGVDPAVVERIGHMPEGHGVLGLLTGQQAPIRLVDLRAHPAFSGFPAHHPVMDGFLGVPIRVRSGPVIGCLYLTGSANGGFRAGDEQVIVSLAGAAAVAIDNARLHQESAQRERWSVASDEVTRRLMGRHDDHPLDVVLRYARDTASADFASLTLLVGPARLQVAAAIGALAEDLVGLTVDTGDSLAGEVVRTRTPVRTAGAVDPALPNRVGPVIVVPLTAGGRVKGTLNVGRVVGAPSFSDADTNALAGFAGQVGFAVDLDHARGDQITVADHDRIGADLNEHVIHELFAVALGLEGLISITTAPVHRTRLAGHIDRLDAAIKSIRLIVYNLTVFPKRQDDLRDRLLSIVDQHTPALGLPVGLRFTGLSDHQMSTELADDLLAVVRETMTDLARHNGTSRVQLSVEVAEDLVLVEIIISGHDAESHTRPDTLSALRSRAEAHAGALRHFTPSTGDSRLVWTARILDGDPKLSR